MKIAMIAPPIERVPPGKYGGTERFVQALTEELIRRGHDVTLFASGDSITNATLNAIYPRSLRADELKEPAVTSYSLLNAGIAYERHHEFDIIHDNTLYLGIPMANLISTPTVITVHNHFDDHNQKLFARLSKAHFVAISHAQQSYAPSVHFTRMIHHGLHMDDYPFSAEPENYLLYVGRISPEKGVHHAIEAAKKLDLPLIIAAKLDTYYEEYLIYYRDHIEPHLSDKIKFIGEVDTKKRNELMSKALAFLHPVTWPEPFGLTLIEAMACGCPVVAFRQGSIPELVQEGKTGFVVETVDEMVEAIKRIPALSREECMKYSRTHFNARRMADEYEQLYNEIVNRRISSEQSAREEAEGKL